MNHDNEQPTESDGVDAAVAALQARPIPPGPSADLVAATTMSIQGQSARSVDPIYRRRRVLAFLGFGSLAASILVAGLALIGPAVNKAAALERSLEKVEKTEAVRFRVTMTFAGRVLPTSVVTVRGNRCRIDDWGLLDSSWIIDLDAKAALITQPKTAKYQSVDLSHGYIAPVEVVGLNVREQLLALRGQKAVAAGVEAVEGILADKFVIKAGKAFHLNGEWTIWIGQKSGLPVKVSVQALSQGQPMTRIFSAFDWNPTTDAATFAIDPPAGFTEAVILHIFPPLPPRKKN
jgi:hypothetical protein